MKPGNIIKYMNACGKIKQAVVAAETHSETPHNIRIFNYPFDENSKSYVLGLDKKKRSESFLKEAWDYTVTSQILKEEENLLETLIKEMGPLSDRF